MPERRWWRKLLLQALSAIAALAAVSGIYSLYKVIGRALEDGQRDWWFIGTFLPRSTDRDMPPIRDIISEFNKPLREGGPKLIGLIWDSSLFTLREAVAGFVLGVIIGMAIAILLLRSRTLEKGTMPYVIASQTVPLIAITPIIVIWGRKNFGFFPWEWQDWMSVSLIAVYLTFFPVAVNGLRGLQSPDPDSKELMNSYAAGWWQTLWRLRLPASLPYLFPAFKIAALASIIGAIVGEISAAQSDGIGYLILDFASKYSTGPERLYASIIGAAVLGLFAAAVITLVEFGLLVRRRQTART